MSRDLTDPATLQSLADALSRRASLEREKANASKRARLYRQSMREKSLLLAAYLAADIAVPVAVLAVADALKCPADDIRKLVGLAQRRAAPIRRIKADQVALEMARNGATNAVIAAALGISKAGAGRAVRRAHDAVTRQ